MRSSTSSNVGAMLMTALVLAVLVATQIVRTQPLSVLSQFGFTDQDIAAIESGRAVTSVLPWGSASEMHVFGAVHVNASPAAYLRDVRDVTRFTARTGYLAAGELSATATAADLDALSFGEDDVKAMKTCRKGACDVQLPADSIRTFHDHVRWSEQDAPAEVNRLARGMLIELLNAYRRGGNGALGAFDDKARPGAETFFYWEKVSFGLKPTIRLNHAVVYHTSRQARDVDVVAIKQLYASHYFHTALDVSVCVGDGAVEAALTSIKRTLEAG